MFNPSLRSVSLHRERSAVSIRGPASIECIASLSNPWGPFRLTRHVSSCSVCALGTDSSFRSQPPQITTPHHHHHHPTSTACLSLTTTYFTNSTSLLRSVSFVVIDSDRALHLRRSWLSSVHHPCEPHKAVGVLSTRRPQLAQASVLLREAHGDPSLLRRRSLARSTRRPQLCSGVGPSASSGCISS